jgi:2-polyprenyl-3-methyl-5-hydroxy-6-metoxy-1,4-benzoquinol methylase
MTETQSNSGDQRIPFGDSIGPDEHLAEPLANLVAVDPLATFLSDPESHLSDILYLYFRIYKKRLFWRFLKAALSGLHFDPSDTIFIADVGASMGFDALYLLRKLTRNFSEPLPCARIHLSLVEGDQNLITEGERTLNRALGKAPVDFEYYRHPLVECLPLQKCTYHLVICSEVVEHLEEPEKLVRELYRILRPGGFLILTTDNSPNLLQHLKRIPLRLNGHYRRIYARPPKESTAATTMLWNGREYPIFGHINLNPTRHWERLCTAEGLEISAYGTYESIRRGGGSKSPLALAAYFTFGALVYYLMPKTIGRFFGDTTALLLRKPGVQRHLSK